MQGKRGCVVSPNRNKGSVSSSRKTDVAGHHLLQRGFGVEDPLQRLHRLHQARGVRSLPLQNQDVGAPVSGRVAEGRDVS